MKTLFAALVGFTLLICTTAAQAASTPQSPAPWATALTLAQGKVRCIPCKVQCNRCGYNFPKACEQRCEERGVGLVSPHVCGNRFKRC